MPVSISYSISHHQVYYLQKKKRWEGKEWIYTYRPTTAMSVYTHNHTLACHHCYNQGKPRVKWDE